LGKFISSFGAKESQLLKSIIFSNSGYKIQSSVDIYLTVSFMIILSF